VENQVRQRSVRVQPVDARTLQQVRAQLRELKQAPDLGNISGPLQPLGVFERPDGPVAQRAPVVTDLYDGFSATPPATDHLWSYFAAAYWALDDGQMDTPAVMSGGALITGFEFAIGMYADAPGDQLAPRVYVSFWNAPDDPVADAANPVVDPLNPVASFAVDLGTFVLPAAGEYSTVSPLIDLSTLSAEFVLDDTFYVEILPTKLHGGVPVADPNIFAVFTQGPIALGTNQDRLWSDVFVYQSGCSVLVNGNHNGLYDHPAELHQGGCSNLEAQSPIHLIGTPLSNLVLEVPDGCLGGLGDILDIELWMRNLPQTVTGFQAFLDFDPAVLDYRGDLSAYTATPFNLHIRPTASAEVAPGELELDGSAAFSNPGTDLDSLLATLRFEPLAECVMTSVGFRQTLFDSEVSVEGDPLPTSTLETRDFYLDGAGPVLTCPVDVTVECGESTDPVDTGVASAVDNCDPMPTITYSDVITPGICDAEETITRIWRAEDDCGNVTTCGQIITVDDSTDPVITCPADLSVPCELAQVRIAGTHTVPDGNVHPSFGNYRPFMIDTNALLLFDGTHGSVKVTGSVDISSLANNSSVFVGLIAKPQYEAWKAAGIPGGDDPTDSVSGFFGFIDTAYAAFNTLSGGRLGLGQQLSFGSTTQTYVGSGLGTNISGFEIVFEESQMLLTLGATTVSQNYQDGFNYIEYAGYGGPQPIPTDWGQGAYAFVGTFFDKLGGAPVIDVTFTQEALPDPLNTGVATATDNCDGAPDVTYSDSATGGACPQEKTVTRTWTATDACGNAASCDQTIDVEDTIAPVITCPADVTIQCDASQDPSNTGSATAIDNCDPAPAVTYSDDFGGLTLCDGTGTFVRTWTATDGCGHMTTCDQVITLEDTTAPVITCPADTTIECDESSDPSNTGSATATDNCDGAPVVTYSDAEVAGACAAAKTITRTWMATDGCGNPVSCDQTIAVDDTTDPMFTTVPADITTNADAGGCTLTLSAAEIGAPTATDNCDPAVDITFLRSDGAGNIDDPFALADSPVTIAWTATDDCGNSVQHVQTVTVNAFNDVSVAVELTGVNLPVSRCIHFVPDDCGNAVDALVAFVDHDGDDANHNGVIDSTEGGSPMPSTSVRFVGTIELPCGLHTQLCAKDEQHTLWATTTLTDAGATYSADSLLQLRGGDTDNDGDVDIHDVTWFILQFQQLANAGGCGWDGTRDADFSNNGAVLSEDYTFLTANWLALSSCGCTARFATGAGTTPGRVAVSIDSISAMSPAARPADLNDDGVLDYRDVRVFETRHGLPHTLSAAIQRARPAPKPAPSVQPVRIER